MPYELGMYCKKKTLKTIEISSIAIWIILWTIAFSNKDKVTPFIIAMAKGLTIAQAGFLAISYWILAIMLIVMVVELLKNDPTENY